REVQPVLDEYCIGCHDGTERPNGMPSMDLKTRAHITDYTSVFHSGGKDAGHFSVSYANLHRFVRRPGLESDYHMLMPMEYHADSTQLVQRLRKGHGNVKIDPESWDRIITWIDLNAPFHGTWAEIAGAERVEKPARRRRELLAKYAGFEEDPEAIHPTEHPYLSKNPSAMLPEAPPSGSVPEDTTWAFSADEAKRRQLAASLRFASDGADVDTETRTIDLGEGMSLELVLIPAGEFAMGDADGCSDEVPVAPVSIDGPFWMGRLEVTNALFNRFDPLHDSRVESRFSMQFGVRGFYVNAPEQPVVRVSWEQAMAFCDWLSDTTGETFTLPTEAQWEYACRAGTATPFFYGTEEADFSSYANLADEKLREFVCHTYKKEREPWLNASKYDDWIPKDTRFNDGGFLSEKPGRYEANPWGLHDMHGNVSEWTRSVYRPYPYSADDGRNDVSGEELRVARGGSWRDRPKRARSAFRLSYRPYQAVYNVGFRVICPASRVVKAQGGSGAVEDRTARRSVDQGEAGSG
ncbi:MAG: formylglycine-generating enzyme family protein, partial [bacterium]|nr:formylglycine-generating enzyme family protein [bacterium]